jgi:glycosyltransferase involved in cell wall biosynthesis
MNINSMNPLVSIGMSVFNCEATLRPAIQSILNQTYSNWELILIDDGSKDRTLEIAKSFKDSRIQVVSDGLNMKLPSRLNQSIAISNGKYFARMDGDDISYPERLQRQVAYMETHPEVDLLGTQTIIFSRDGQAMGMTSGKQSHSEICSRPWAGFSTLHPTWMGKFDWFHMHQYRSDAIRMEDYDLLLRTYKSSQFACLPDILFGYRVESLSLKKILNARYHNSIALSRKAFSEKNYLFAYGVLEQAAKALVDTFAITTGLNFNILKHRVGSPMQEAELTQWKQIWDQCNNEFLSV